MRASLKPGLILAPLHCRASFYLYAAIIFIFVACLAIIFICRNCTRLISSASSTLFSLWNWPESSSHRRTRTHARARAHARAHTTCILYAVYVRCAALYCICCGLGAWSRLRFFVQRLPCFSSWSLSLTSPSPSLPRPLQILLARALQRARSFVRDETGCMRRSSGCMRRPQWSRPNWVRFALCKVTRPTWVCVRF